MTSRPRALPLLYLSLAARLAAALLWGLAAAAAGAGHPLAAQVSIVEEPSDAQVKAAYDQLRQVESAGAAKLRRGHGDPATGKALGEALRDSTVTSLNHPSRAMRRALAAARDPAALALALAGRVGESDLGGYEVDVLLLAIAQPGAAARRADLWTRAAAIEWRDTALHLAFLERAYALLGGAGGSAGTGAATAGAAPGCEHGVDDVDAVTVLAEPCMIAADQVKTMLDSGMAREAIATFDAQPAAHRERIFASWAKQRGNGADRRIALAAARWLTGDAAGARATRAQIEIAPWQGDDKLDDLNGENSSAVYLALLDLVLAPPPGDPFAVFANFVALNLFGPVYDEVWGVSDALFGRLADREGYPGISVYAWIRAARSARSATHVPWRVPDEVRSAVQRLRTALAREFQSARTAAIAADAAQRLLPKPAVRCLVDCNRLDTDRGLELFALDRTGKVGVALIDHAPYYGEVFRIELRDEGLVAVRKLDWIS